MNRQSIIVVIGCEPNVRQFRAGKFLALMHDDVQTYGNLKKACKAHEWNYHTIVKKKLPIEHEGFLIYRTKFQ